MQRVRTNLCLFLNLSVKIAASSLNRSCWDLASQSALRAMGSILSNSFRHLRFERSLVQHQHRPVARPQDPAAVAVVSLTSRNPKTEERAADSDALTVERNYF
jgi:hypothetical protein